MWHHFIHEKVEIVCDNSCCCVCVCVSYVDSCSQPHGDLQDEVSYVLSPCEPVCSQLGGSLVKLCLKPCHVLLCSFLKDFVSRVIAGSLPLPLRV